MKKIVKSLAAGRMIILSVLGVALYFSIWIFHISLWYILIAGAVLGAIFGKVFCRWVCPLGLLMEFLMGMNKSGSISQMYQYHKIGCPIAWISGWLNKYSIFKIKFSESECKTCGACDKQCYIVSMEPHRYSLYKPEMKMPGESYTCSKCLKCVAVCPNKSLTYKP